MPSLIFTNSNCVGCNKCIKVCSCMGANISEYSTEGNSKTADFTKEWSRATASELEYVRTKICDNEVKQITCPRDSKIQDSPANFSLCPYLS